MVTISFPLSQEQAIAITCTAEAFGVEPWEMALHVVATARGHYYTADERPVTPLVPPKEER